MMMPRQLYGSLRIMQKSATDKLKDMHETIMIK